MEKTLPEVVLVTGRCKEVVCRVNLKSGKGLISINGKGQKEYLCRDTLVQNITQLLNVVEMGDKFDIVVKVSGGGMFG